jgi:hypothetical protein
MVSPLPRPLTPPPTRTKVREFKGQSECEVGATWTGRFDNVILV